MKELQELAKRLHRHHLTRRDFMSRASALGIAAALSPAIFPAIGRASAPKMGGRLRAGAAGGHNSDSLDPGLVTDVVPLFITFGQLRNCLTEVDNSYKPIPELAESWEPSLDATRWTFKLRKGVEFHNGKTLDSKDVIHSFNQHRKKDTKSVAKGIAAQIKEIKADGKYTVSFFLEIGNADFPAIVGDYHFQIVPDGTQNYEDGIGTGGYQLVSFKPGVSSLTKRNPNYWKEGRAHFDEVEIICIADEVARTNALKTGEIDVMNRCEPRTFRMLKKVHEIQGVESQGSSAYYTWAMLTDRPPFNNNDARLAMKYAIDREHMLKQMLGGHGSVGNDHPIGPTYPYVNEDLPQRQYDPEKASYHFKKAGLEGQSINLYAADAGFQGAVDAAVLYKGYAAKAGININVVREPNDGYWSNVWMKKTMCPVFWNGKPTEDWMFSTAYAADAAWNDTFWKHERFNELLLKARGELDITKRREMYYEMQKYVRDDGGNVVWCFNNYLSALSDKIGFGPQLGNMELDGSKAFERWWFKS